MLLCFFYICDFICNSTVYLCPDYVILFYIHFCVSIYLYTCVVVTFVALLFVCHVIGYLFYLQ